MSQKTLNIVVIVISLIVIGTFVVGIFSLARDWWILAAWFFPVLFGGGIRVLKKGEKTDR